MPSKYHACVKQILSIGQVALSKQKSLDRNDGVCLIFNNILGLFHLNVYGGGGRKKFGGGGGGGWGWGGGWWCGWVGGGGVGVCFLV